ncbi:MAG: YIP1 family protein [Candidatus Obscuribacterales bacterium]|nr:YIP1 family protein [Candidatus Obscuribacterales bacterium]
MLEITWIECFLGTILAPSSVFKILVDENNKNNRYLIGSLFAVIVVYAAAGIALSSESSSSAILVNTLGSIFSGLVIWLLTVFTVGLAAVCFGKDKHTLRSLALTVGWSMVPLIFIGPLSCLPAPLLAFLALLLLCWVFALQIMAIRYSCQLKSWQSLMFVFLVPALFAWLQFFQFLKVLEFALAPFFA